MMCGSTRSPTRIGRSDEDLIKKKIIIVTYGSVVRRGKIRVGCYTGGGQKLSRRFWKNGLAIWRAAKKKGCQKRAAGQR